MDATPVTDFAASIRYALTPRTAADDRVDIVLDLYRGGVPALSRTIARVASQELHPVMVRCRRHLERRGAHALGGGIFEMPRKAAPDPGGAAPLAAFDWMFAG